MSTVKYGMLDEIEWDDSMSGGCDGGSASESWSMVAGYDGKRVRKDNDNDGYEEIVDEYDEIEVGLSDQHRVFMHFDNRPKECVIDACNVYRLAKPHNFSITIDVPAAFSTEEIYFDDADPVSGNTDDSYDEYDLTMDIFSSFGGQYGAIGEALVNYLIDSSGASVSVTNRNADFDIPVKGDHGDLPRETSDNAEVAEAKVRTYCEVVGDNYYTIYQPQYTFAIRYLDSATCNCTQAYWKYKTTAPGYSSSASFDGVNSE
jgi:hypothetical protein